MLSQVRIKKIRDQLQLKSEADLIAQLSQLTAGTVWADAHQTSNSVFYTLFKELILEPFRQNQASYDSYIESSFAKHAAGEMLQLHLLDHGLEPYLGDKARHNITITKETSSTLSVTTDTAFHVKESNPRTFYPIQNESFPSATSFVLVVEAAEVGQRYNVAVGQITECIDASIDGTISNLEVQAFSAGADPETDEMAQDRIVAIKGLSVQTGNNTYYLSVLKTVGGVIDAQYIETGVDGTISYAIFGVNGVSAAVLQAAQDAVGTQRILTDNIIVLPAAEQSVDINIKINMDPAEYLALQPAITTAISSYFSSMERNTNFNDGLLIHHLYSALPDLAGKEIQILQDVIILESSKYFVPNLIFDDWDWTW